MYFPLAPSHVTFLITGKGDADEDAALADYLELKLKGEKPPLAPFLKRVQESTLGEKILVPSQPSV